MSQAAAVIPEPTMIPANMALAITQQLFTCPERWNSEVVSRVGQVRLISRKHQEAATWPRSPAIPGSTPAKLIRLAVQSTTSAAVVVTMGRGLRSWRRWQSRHASTKATDSVRMATTAPTGSKVGQPGGINSFPPSMISVLSRTLQAVPADPPLDPPLRSVAARS